MRQWQFPECSFALFHSFTRPFSWPNFIFHSGLCQLWKARLEKGGKSWTISQQEPKTFISMCSMRVYVCLCGWKLEWTQENVGGKSIKMKKVLLGRPSVAKDDFN